MKKIIEQFIGYLGAVNRPLKVVTQIFFDSLIIAGCFIFAMAVRLDFFTFYVSFKAWLAFISSMAVALTVFWLSGLYRNLVRFLTGNVIGAIGRGVLAFAVTMLVINSYILAGIPRSVPIMTAALALLAIAWLRFLVREVLRVPLKLSRRPVAIYGAGDAGLELLNSLAHSRDYVPIAFLDDDKRMQGLTVGGCRVYAPNMLGNLKGSIGLDAVFLAVPNVSPLQRNRILYQLERVGVEVKTIPSLSDIISGRASISQLRHVEPEELLGREPVLPNEQLISKNTAGQVVMVTGAGGSIGSELCRQILSKKPKAIVLYEISELALYRIAGELAEAAKRINAVTEILQVLGSVQDEVHLDSVIRAFKVKTIYHAAAYKHVPIVEENIISGIRNNVFGTLTAARLAHKNGVERFILISTDKAVRPTNVMGATKRIAELVCQAFAKEDTKTVYSMVRFGNVLGSSGSVIPRFAAQIEAGGPVTVTHPDINRYFMTIPEAAQLVIQAGAMSKGGDVFLLDMAEPVKIVDLAIRMIKLHGLKPYISNENHTSDVPEGHIAIEFTGLRKGEKLFEELLIDSGASPTEHPRVMTASEACLTLNELMESLDKLRDACDSLDITTIGLILRNLPLHYMPNSEDIGDLVWGAIQSGNLRDSLTENASK